MGGGGGDRASEIKMHVKFILQHHILGVYLMEQLWHRLNLKDSTRTPPPFFPHYEKGGKSVNLEDV